MTTRLQRKIAGGVSRVRQHDVRAEHINRAVYPWCAEEMYTTDLRHTADEGITSIWIQMGVELAAPYEGLRIRAGCRQRRVFKAMRLELGTDRIHHICSSRSGEVGDADALLAIAKRAGCQR